MRIARALAAPIATLLPVIVLLAPPAARGGVTNPDISVIGQPYVTWTDDPADPDRLRLRPEIGETEAIFDAALNPYARGTFTLSIGEEGLALEEGYFKLNRGLPLDLALKGGQYRTGFGRMNIVHPHALPFAERFGLLAAYLPGEESFNEVGASLSRRIPVAGEFSIDLAADWLQGDSFRIEREPAGEGDPLAEGGDDDAGLTRAGWLGRLSGFTMLGEQSALDFGLSASGGTNNVAAGTRTLLFGADLKAKLWTAPQAYLLLQAEAIRLDRDDAGWDPETGYTRTNVTPWGGSLYADYNWATRYNVGASWERFQEPSPDEAWEESLGLFAGYSLMEETTVLRADWRLVRPPAGDDYGRFNLRVIFSMGPHKAHQF